MEGEGALLRPRTIRELHSSGYFNSHVKNISTFLSVNLGNRVGQPLRLVNPTGQFLRQASRRGHPERALGAVALVDVR